MNTEHPMSLVKLAFFAHKLCLAMLLILVLRAGRHVAMMLTQFKRKCSQIGQEAGSGACSLIYCIFEYECSRSQRSGRIGPVTFTILRLPNPDLLVLLEALRRALQARLSLPGRLRV